MRAGVGNLWGSCENLCPESDMLRVLVGQLTASGDLSGVLTFCGDVERVSSKSKVMV